MLEGRYASDPQDLLDVASFVANTLRRPWWHQFAACRGQGPATWFPARGESGAPARAVCATCSVREDCLADALSHGSLGLDAGIWADTSPNERKAMRRAMPVSRSCAAASAAARTSKPASAGPAPAARRVSRPLDGPAPPPPDVHHGGHATRPPPVADT